MIFTSEIQFENYIRELIRKHITSKDKDTYALLNKKAVDIIVCKDKPKPKLFFLEVKYHINKHGRLGFGSGAGGGFQPEILSKRPKYFEKNLRWVISAEDSDKILFITNDTLLKYISGGTIGQKFNNIQKKIFTQENGLTEKEFIAGLINWLT